MALPHAYNARTSLQSSAETKNAITFSVCICELCTATATPTTVKSTNEKLQLLRRKNRKTNSIVWFFCSVFNDSCQVRIELKFPMEFRRYERKIGISKSCFLCLRQCLLCLMHFTLHHLHPRFLSFRYSLCAFLLFPLFISTHETKFHCFFPIIFLPDEDMIQSCCKFKWHYSFVVTFFTLFFRCTSLDALFVVYFLSFVFFLFLLFSSFVLRLECF